MENSSAVQLITIDGFESLDEHQLFKMSAEHILSTGKQSRRESASGTGTCQYGGSGCAASVFIKPELREAADRLEADWNTLVRGKHVPAANKDFISRLQRAHDECNSGTGFMAAWKANMRVIADDRGIYDVPGLD